MDSETLRNELLTSQWYGISPGNISYTGGNVGIGTNNPIYTLDVLGIVRAGSTVSSSIYLTNSEVKWRGDGTAHFSIFNQNSTFQIRNTSGNFEPGTAGSNLVTVTTSGNVGIGKTNPVTTLDVAGYTRIGNTGSDTARLILGPAPSGTNLDYASVIESISSVASNYSSILKFYTHGNGTTAGDPTLAMTINSAQQVGIGTASPGNTLDVYQSVNAGNAVRAYNPNTGTGAYGGFIMGTNDSGNRGGIITFNSAYTASAQYRTSGVYIYCNGAGGITLHAEGANNLFFATNSAERMRVTSAGNVGIGTTNPPGKLSVGTNGDAESMAVGSWSDRYFCVGQAPTPNSSCVSIGFNNTTAIGWIYSLAPSVAWRTLNFGAANYNFLCASTTPSMTISSTGINVPGVITNQGRPMSMAGKNNGDVTGGIMVFNNVAYNIGSMYNSSNGRWTASVAGYYQFTYSGLSSYTTVYPNMRWNKNGSDFGWGATHFNMGGYAGNPHHLQMATSLIIFLAVNDYVEFNVINNGFYGGTTIHSTACCIFLG